MVALALALAEEYDEARAVGHIRRLLDIVACTTSFGAWASRNKDSSANKNASATTTKSKSSSTSTAAMDGDGDGDKDGEEEMKHSCPKLGTFYDFFSLSHLTPPLQCNNFVYSFKSFFFLHNFKLLIIEYECGAVIRRATRRHVDEIDSADDDDDLLFSFDVTLSFLNHIIVFNYIFPFI